MPKQVRILIAESHFLVRQGLRQLLAASQEFMVVAEATEGAEVVRLCATLHPDILLLSLSMNATSFTPLMKDLHERCPHTRVIMLTAVSDDAYTIGALSAGAAGVVLSDEAATTLADAIRTVMQGFSWFSRVIVDRLICLTPQRIPALLLAPPME